MLTTWKIKLKQSLRKQRYQHDLPQQLQSSHKEHTVKNKRRVCITGTVLGILGLLTITVALVAHFVIPMLVKSKVEAMLVVSSSSQSSDQYQQWVTNADANAPKKYNSLYFYHIENIDEFLMQGLAPRMQQRGPYVFREQFRHVNVTFTPDGNQVSYSDKVTNTFVPEMSNGTLQDKVSILNLPYVKVMSKMGSESGVMRAGGTQVFNKALTQMHDKMIPAIKAGSVSQAIMKAANALKTFSGNGGWDNMMSIMGGNCPGNQCHIKELFLIDWIAGNITFMLETGLCGEFKCENAIPGAVMNQIMNISDSFSVVNASKDYGATLWMESDPELLRQNQQNITAHFNITSVHFTILRQWLITVVNNPLLAQKVYDTVNSGVNSKYHVNDWLDLPYRQWLKADVLAKLQKSSSSMVSVQPESPVELPFSFSSRNRTLLSEPSSIDRLSWSLDTVKCLAQAIGANKFETLFDFADVVAVRPGKMPEFTRDELDFFAPNQTVSQCLQAAGDQVGTQVLKSYMKYMASTVMRQQLQQVWNSGGGLVVTRTVEQHALGEEEPLLKLLLDPSDPRTHKHSILVNDDNLDDAQSAACTSTADMDDDYFACRQVRIVQSDGTVLKTYYRAPSGYHTGKGDIKRVSSFADYHSYSSIDNVFINDSLQITGATQNMDNSVQYGYGNAQGFPPNQAVGPLSTLYILLPNVPAPFALKYNNTVNDLKRIEMHRFKIPADQFHRIQGPYAPNLNLSQLIGNGDGVDVSELKGFAVSVTPVHYSGFPDQQSIMQSYGIPNDGNSLYSYLDVEPVTGKTMRVSINLQIVASTTSAKYDVSWPQVYQTSMLPVMWRQVTSEVTPALASQFKTQVHGARDMSNYSLWVGVPVGCVLFMTGLGLYLYSRQMRSKEA